MKAHRIVGTLALASFFAITENSGEAVANRRPTPALGWQSIGPSPPAVEAPVAVDPASGTIYIAALVCGVWCVERDLRRRSHLLVGA